MDLYRIAHLQLTGLGIQEGNISRAEWDTFADKRFHSARRDKNHSGRMFTVIWLE